MHPGHEGQGGSGQEHARPLPPCLPMWLLPWGEISCNCPGEGCWGGAGRIPGNPVASWAVRRGPCPSIVGQRRWGGGSFQPAEGPRVYPSAPASNMDCEWGLCLGGSFLGHMPGYVGTACGTGLFHHHRPLCLRPLLSSSPPRRSYFFQSQQPLLFLMYTSHAPTSAPSYLLFPLPARFLPRYPRGSCPLQLQVSCPQWGIL